MYLDGSILEEHVGLRHPAEDDLPVHHPIHWPALNVAANNVLRGRLGVQGLSDLNPGEPHRDGPEEQLLADGPPWVHFRPPVSAWWALLSLGGGQQSRPGSLFFKHRCCCFLQLMMIFQKNLAYRTLNL